MSETKTIFIQLSLEDSDRLEAEAQRLSISADTLASLLLHERLSGQRQPADPLNVLTELRNIGRSMPLNCSRSFFAK